MNCLEWTKAYEEPAIAIRRWFHMHPEKSYCETNTARRIRDELDRMGIVYQDAGANGTIGIIRGNGEGPVLALRADIDALEITEQNDVPYRSVHDGIMHACGHDAHIAALLLAARVLSEHREAFRGSVKLIFQPSEEHGTGAEKMLASGLLDDVDAFFGLHVRPTIPAGTIALRDGPVMGGANSLKIRLHGKAGHGGRPEQTIDTIAAGSEIVQALQHIVSREIPPTDPAVVSVCQFHAGTRDNIIAGEASISGTVRILHERTRRQIQEAVPRIVHRVAEAHRVEAEVECEFATMTLINSSQLHPVVVRAAQAIIPPQNILTAEPELVTEDFSVYGKKAPAYFAFVGSGKGNPLHNDHFDIDEECIPIAAALHVAFVLHSQS